MDTFVIYNLETAEEPVCMQNLPPQKFPFLPSQTPAPGYMVSTPLSHPVSFTGLMKGPSASAGIDLLFLVSCHLDQSDGKRQQGSK